jgi:hypothetical protein
VPMAVFLARGELRAERTAQAGNAGAADPSEPTVTA